VRDDEDRAGFVAALEQACARTDWQVPAWCLLSNHFHLVVETPRANLAPGMKWFLGLTRNDPTRGIVCAVMFSAGATAEVGLCSSGATPRGRVRALNSGERDSGF